jgi:hypothetical protein
LVEGNYIGTDARGENALGNAIGISPNYPDTIIGNLISGNTQFGINVPRGGKIQGNLIGTDARGMNALGNGVGISVGTGVIGGTTPAERNIISGNTGYDIAGSESPGLYIEGNYIGADITGMNEVGSRNAGIYLFNSGGATIGGLTGTPGTGAGNLIAVSGNEAVLLQSETTDVIQGNLIKGTFGGFHTVGCNNMTIGGTDPQARNIISGINGDAIQIFNGSHNVVAGNTIDHAGFGVNIDSGTGNSILRNSIFSNNDGGIFLNGANNANNSQASPGLTSATGSVSGTIIGGTFQSRPSTTFRLEFFSNMALDTGANQGGVEGQTYLGFVSITTDASGNVISSPDGTATVANGIFTTAPGRLMPLPLGQTVLSSTATNLTTGDSSGFSNYVSIPVVGPITAPAAPVAISTAINVSATFTDAVTSTTHQAVWNWGDGTPTMPDTSLGSVTESNGSGTVTGSHTYAVDGVYTITLTVTNNLGGSGQTVFQFIVIYNPSGGIVTGGGWITSPAGAYVANPSLTGKTDFGIDVKYKSGSTAPTGNTQFTLPAAGQAFQSTSYAWLTISGTMAQYQGTGTINGAGSYGFIATVTDGKLLGGTAPDTFRIRIWDSTKGNGSTSAGLIYDNYASAPIYNNPSGTVLGGGNITIHKSNQTAAGGPGPNSALGPVLTAEQLQPIVAAAIARWQEAGATPAQLSPLAQLTYQIVSLPPGILAMTGPGIIWVSPNADGYGWFLDANPTDDGAFTGVASSPAQKHMDLLSVMAHELGHIILGIDESVQPNDVMTEALPLGVRRLPTPSDLGLQPSTTWANSHTSTGLKGARGMADGGGILPRDSLFAVGQPTQQFLAVFQAQQPEAPTPGSVVLLSTAWEGEGLLPNRPPLTAAGLKYHQISDNGAAGWMGYALDDALVDQLVRDRLG